MVGGLIKSDPASKEEKDEEKIRTMSQDIEKVGGTPPKRGGIFSFFKKSFRRTRMD